MPEKVQVAMTHRSEVLRGDSGRSWLKKAPTNANKESENDTVSCPAECPWWFRTSTDSGVDGVRSTDSEGVDGVRSTDSEDVKGVMSDSEGVIGEFLTFKEELESKLSPSGNSCFTD